MEEEKKVEGEEVTTEEVKTEEVKTEKVEETETVDKDIYESVKEGMQKEREARKAEREKRIQLEKELEEAKAQKPVENNLADVEVKADIALKLATDPGFRDRKELVEDTMIAEGLTIEEADAKVKAKLYEKLIEDKQDDTPQVVPPTLNNKATQEEAQTKKAETLKEMVNDPNTDPALAAAFKNKFGL